MAEKHKRRTYSDRSHLTLKYMGKKNGPVIQSNKAKIKEASFPFASPKMLRWEKGIEVIE